LETEEAAMRAREHSPLIGAKAPLAKQNAGALFSDTVEQLHIKKRDATLLSSPLFFCRGK
jgi:hypothetical protein